MNKNLISPGCGYCIMENICIKRKLMIDRKRNGMLSNEDAFLQSHMCGAFKVHPDVGKSKEQLMERFK